MYPQADGHGAAVLDVLTGERGVADACVEVCPNLYLIPGSRDLIHYDFENCETVLAEVLAEETMAEVDFVIVDHPRLPRLPKGHSK